MTVVLAIETSTLACSVALRVGDSLISRYSEEPRSHTRLVMSMVDEVIKEAGLNVTAIDGLAVTVGPGSFTGLRIGFAAIQGLSFGLDLPVVAVSTLQVMAETAVRKSELGQVSLIVPVLDARMGEFNCGCYQLESGQFSAVRDDQLLSAEGALQLINQYQDCVIVGEASDLDIPMFIAVYPDAVDLLNIAMPKFIGGLSQPIDAIELVYLRGADAWQKRKRVRVV